MRLSSVERPDTLARITLLAGIVLVISLVTVSPLSGIPRPLVPVDDLQAAGNLLPAGVNRTQPDIFANYVYVQSQPDGTQVLQFEGDFGMQIGSRRIESQQAVIWMQANQWQNLNYYHYEIYLSRFATVRDSVDTITSGPTLFVTLNTTRAPEIHNDVHTRQSPEDTKLYQEATRVRLTMLASGPTATQPAGLDVRPTEAPEPAPRPKARPTVHLDAGKIEMDSREGTITVTGDVRVSQGMADSKEVMELRTDAAVLFMAQPQAGKPGTPPSEISAPALELIPAGRSGRSSDEFAASLGLGEGVGARVSGIYLQGNVILSRGDRRIRASELYYDFENDRALILDAVMSAVVPDRNIPIYVRAKQVRQLSTTDYVAKNAIITTSEFHTPHLHIGASEVRLTDAALRDQSGQITGIESGKYQMRDTTLNLEGVPIAYWPYVAGDFRRGDTPLNNIRMGYSEDFGATVETRWYLFNLLGMEQPPGVDGFLRLDYYSKRGPAVGVDFDYQTDNAFGLVRSYYIYDHGTDNLGPYRNGDFPSPDRGRALIRHRQILPDGWELTLEASYISDANFLEEYFRPEFQEGKEQETLLYLKKQQDNWAFTTLAQWRILDWLTQTEHLPDLGFHWVGQPLAQVLNYYNESHIGMVRYRADDRRFFNYNRLFDNTSSTGEVFRTETRNEIDMPMKFSAVNLNLVPYAVGRAGYWSDSPHDGGVDRIFGMAGIRAGTQFWRLFENAVSRILDVNGVRHIVSPEITAWGSADDLASRDLTPFDQGIETIDDFSGTSIALRQRWQTKRGGPSDAGGSGQWRKVDWIRFDVELNLFSNSPSDTLPIGRYYAVRQEDSVARNHVRSDFMYRISDTTAILSNSNIDLNDGDMDLYDVSYAVERTPRFAYFVGYRLIHDTDSDLIGAGANYEFNTKYRVAVRTYYDIERSETDIFEISLIRKWPRWYTALTFELDNLEDVFGLSLSVWPEGAPQLALGSRKYTSLSESVGIRPPD
jgi:lipopolysaccharide export system protein LptA